jgi:hypothetical protein
MLTPFLKAFLTTPRKGYPANMVRITCADGESVSVQASAHHYCTPRDNNGPWIEVEAGFPTCSPPPSWQEYAESPNKLTETVYGCMPIGRIEEFIEAHGGENTAVMAKRLLEAYQTLNERYEKVLSYAHSYGYGRE